MCNNCSCGKYIYKLKDATCTVTVDFVLTYVIGSGFFIKYCGKYYIITCAHLVYGTPFSVHVDVQNANGVANKHVQIKCDVVGIDFAADIAVLRPLTTIESPGDGFDLFGHPYLTFGHSTCTDIGSSCYIIGNAGGLDPFSICDGLVRDNKYVSDLATETMLISAPTWSGNSGSPILNSQGLVIGMVCFIFGLEEQTSSTLVGGSTQYMLQNIVKKIIKNNGDYITKGYMGIQYFVPVSDLALIFLRNMYPNFLAGVNDILKGLMILNVEEPAITATTPLQTYDIITRIKSLSGNREFNLGCFDKQYHPSRLTWFLSAGDQVELTVTRPSTNTVFTTTITLITYPPIYDFPFSGAVSSIQDKTLTTIIKKDKSVSVKNGKPPLIKPKNHFVRNNVIGVQSISHVVQKIQTSNTGSNTNTNTNINSTTNTGSNTHTNWTRTDTNKRQSIKPKTKLIITNTGKKKTTKKKNMKKKNMKRRK